MNKLLSLTFILLAGSLFSQYEIKINFKGSKDSVAYLARYNFDKQYLIDTCKKVKGGNIVFKGKKPLEKGVYFVVSQEKSRYFDIFVNECSKMTITCDNADIVKSLKSTDCKENDDFFSYIRFITLKNKDFDAARAQTKGKTKADSAKYMQERIKVMNEEVKKFDTDYLVQKKGTYIADVLNLKSEKEATDIPKAKNGRPDSTFQYIYYKTHYWDGVNFGDDRLMRTPFFADRVKKYFDKVILQVPDTICVEIDRVMNQTKRGSDMEKYLLAYFTPTYESSKIMGFDKIFVHLIDNYIRTGRAKGVYEDAVLEKIKARGDILKPILIGSQSPDLLMIDTVNAKAVNKMGFDTVKTSSGVTKLYYDNAQKLTSMFTTLYSVKAKWTVLVFWDVDCGHCQTEIPKMLDMWHELRKKYDVAVYSVYTQHEYQKYRKYIIDHKLDFINVWDPVHLNNIKEKFDIYSTPVIYLLDRNKIIKAKRLSQEQIPDQIKFYDSIYNDKEKNKK